ncbi:MAG: hypothetical protein ACXIUO_06810 [Erythrobacter sp.]
MDTRARKLERKATGLTILVALQALACGFFVVDLAGDVIAERIGTHLVIEGFAAAALLVALGLRPVQVHGLIASARRDEIAALRGSAASTVRAQLTRAYAKAGVTSQSELIALFLEDLIEVPPQGNAASLA